MGALAEPSQLRLAARQITPRSSQPPPRITRSEPSWEEVHSQTLPCRSKMPNGFGKYEPTSLVVCRYGPLEAAPIGWLPWKLACLEERSSVGTGVRSVFDLAK